MLCDDLGGWDGGCGRKAKGRGDICMHIIDSRCCSAENHCKAIILHFFKKSAKSLFPCKVTNSWSPDFIYKILYIYIYNI